MHAHCTCDSITGVLSAGVGSRDGCSIVVQYQAEISHLQTMQEEWEKLKGKRL